MIRLINSEYSFSYYNNLFSTKENDGVFDINELIETIKHGYLNKPIQKLRTTTDKEVKKKIKQSEIPAIALSGTFKERNSKGLISHSGLIQIDIDDISDRYETLFNGLVDDMYSYVCFRSPSGNGIKVIVKINPSEETHLEQFYALERYYKEEYNIEIDRACKDIARTMLLSSDPNIFCNPFSEVFEELYLPVKQESKEYIPNHKVVSFVSDASSNEEKCIEIIQQLEANQIDLTDNYEDWIRIGFALSGEFGETGRDLFHRVSVISAKYSSKECDRVFTYLHKRNNGGIQFSTFIFHAKQAGITIDYSKYAKPETVVLEKQEQSIAISKEDLLAKLKARRTQLAEKENAPAYIICKNNTLEELAEKRPTELEALYDISGFGPKKVEKYGLEFLSILQSPSIKVAYKPKVKEQVSKLEKLSENQEELKQKLRGFRLDLAAKKGLKPFHIFGNKVLEELIQTPPKSKEDFLEIHGLGEKKYEWFGKELLEKLNK